MPKATNAIGDESLTYECSIQEYKGIEYLYVHLIEGDMRGGDAGNFGVLKSSLLEEIGTQAIDRILIDASGYTGHIDSAAFSGLALLHRRKQTTIYGLVPQFKNAVKGISKINLADDRDSALELLASAEKETA